MLLSIVISRAKRKTLSMREMRRMTSRNPDRYSLVGCVEGESLSKVMSALAQVLGFEVEGSSVSNSLGAFS